MAQSSAARAPAAAADTDADTAADITIEPLDVERHMAAAVALVEADLSEP